VEAASGASTAGGHDRQLSCGMAVVAPQAQTSHASCCKRGLTDGNPTAQPGIPASIFHELLHLPGSIDGCCLHKIYPVFLCMQVKDNGLFGGPDCSPK